MAEGTIETTFEQFSDFVEQGTFIPVCREVRTDLLTPVSAFLTIAEHADHAFLFESVAGGECEQLDVKRPEGLLQSCEFDAMGFSLPAAIGAAVARPGTAAVSIAGDGGFVHTMGELAVARDLGLPVVAVVFVDGALGILRHQAEAMYGEDHFVRLGPIDFAAVARAFGIEARTVADQADLQGAFEWALSQGGPSLLAVAIDPEEVFPPLRTKIEQRKIDLMGR